MDSEVSVTFDEENRVRVLDPADFKASETLEAESGAFVAKVTEFNESMKSLVDGMAKHSKIIEAAKLKAIGMRNLVTSEGENRRRLARDLQATINEKLAELDRYAQEYDSLSKVEAEQKVLMKKLSNNEA